MVEKQKQESKAKEENEDDTACMLQRQIWRTLSLQGDADIKIVD
jgi:hypothetical protein